MTTYVYQRRPAGSPSFEPAGVEEVCQIVGSGLIVKVVRSAPGETVLSLEAHLSKDDGQVASFSCEMRQGKKAPVRASFKFQKGEVAYTRQRGDGPEEEGVMTLPEDVIIYPLGMRWFTGKVVREISQGKGNQRHVFTAKVSHIEDEALFLPQFDSRTSEEASEGTEEVKLEVNGKVYVTRKYVVNGGPYQKAPFWVDELSGSMVKYEFAMPSGEQWLIELCE